MENDAITSTNAVVETARQNQAAQSGNDSTSLNGGASIAQDFDTFLKLLTAQLQNQDPLEPMDTHEFTQQLVQFSEVEQALSTNDKLDELIALQGDGKTAQALEMIGKEVEAEGDQFRLRDGSADLSYTLDGNASVASIVITDGDGSLVRSLDVSALSGEHEVTWDGTTAAGDPVADGVYNMQLLAVDENNATVSGQTFAINEVRGFENRDNQIYLDLGGYEVALEDVRGVAAGPSQGETVVNIDPETETETDPA
jgi:flagellar basal-body rod modification protein FlgD